MSLELLPIGSKLAFIENENWYFCNTCTFAVHIICIFAVHIIKAGINLTVLKEGHDFGIGLELPPRAQKYHRDLFLQKEVNSKFHRYLLQQIQSLLFTSSLMLLALQKCIFLPPSLFSDEVYFRTLAVILVQSTECYSILAIPLYFPLSSLAMKQWAQFRHCVYRSGLCTWLIPSLLFHHILRAVSVSQFVLIICCHNIQANQTFPSILEQHKLGSRLKQQCNNNLEAKAVPSQYLLQSMWVAQRNHGQNKEGKGGGNPHAENDGDSI